MIAGLSPSFGAKTDERLAILSAWGAAGYSAGDPIVFAPELNRAYALGYEDIWNPPGLVRVIDTERLEELEPISLAELGDLSEVIQYIAIDHRTNQLFITTESASPCCIVPVVTVVDAVAGELLTVIELVAGTDVRDIAVDSRFGLVYLLTDRYQEPMKVTVFSTRTHEILKQIELGAGFELDSVTGRLFVKGSADVTVIGLRWPGTVRSGS